MLSFNVFQSKNGFLWAATPQGLTRWDGREYYVFKHEEGDSSSLPGNYVVNMLEDAKGNLWVGTDAGFARFNEKSNTFERHGAAKTYSASFTFLMSCDSKNRLYLYEAGQKCDHRIYDIESQKYVDFSNQLFEQAVFLPKKINSDISVGINSTVIGINSDSTWVVGMNVGSGIRVGFMSGATDTLQRVEHFFDGHNPAFPKAIIWWRMCAENAENIWLGSHIGVILFNTKSKKFKIFDTFGKEKVVNISQLKNAPNGLIAVTTEDNGLFLFDKKKQQFVQHEVHSDFVPTSLASDHARVLATISDQFLLLNTPQGWDIADLSKRPFQKLFSKQEAIALNTSNAVQQIQQWDERYVLLTLSDKKRHFMMYDLVAKRAVPTQQDLTKINDVSKNKPICAVTNSGQNIFYWGDATHLFSYNKKSHTRKDLSGFLPKEIHIEALAFNPDDNELMVAAERKLYLLKQENKRWRCTEVASFSKLASSSTKSISYDALQKCYFALPEYGGLLVRIAKINGSYEVTHQQWLDDVYAFVQDVSADTFFISYLKGVFWCAKKDLSLAPFLKEPKAESNKLSLMLDSGDLLLCEDSGYYFVNSSTHQKNLLMSAKELGFQKPTAGNILFQKDGKILLGGSEGILEIDTKPTKKEFATEPHSLYIHRLVSNSGRIRYEIPLKSAAVYTFPKAENTFTVHFSGINFGAAPLIYEYKLEGYDEDWTSSAVGEVRYVNVPKGDYLFRLREKNQIENCVPLTIYVAAGWYETWWFRLLCFTALGGLLGLITFQRLRVVWAQNETRQKESELREAKALFAKQMAESEMNALKSQMNPHFIFNVLNSIKSYVLTNDTATASMYITKFSKLIRGVLDSSRMEKISLKKELETLELYIEMEKMRFEEKFTYQIEIQAELESDFIEIPPMLVQPYIENAIWHGLMHQTGGKPKLTLRAFMASEHLLQIEVEDNGVGRKKSAEMSSKSANKHKSFGTLITSERIQLINKHYDTYAQVATTDLFDAEQNSCGTRVTISIPIDYD